MERQATTTTQALLKAALGRWRESLVVLACLGNATFPEATQAAEPEASEAAIQAAYLFNFARFTEWPTNAFVTKTAPLNACLLGRREALANAMISLNDRPVQGHPLRFFQPERTDELKLCHLVFIAETDGRRRTQYLQMLASQPTLTVSDIEGFAQEGGMIRIMRVGTRLRFEINRAQTQKIGLKLAADLLNLATTIVEPDSGASR